MRNKKISMLVMLFLLACLCCTCVLYASEKKTDITKKNSNYLIVYYFHGTYRCFSCRTIEQYSREAIEENFPYQLETKKLFFKAVNVDLPENQHFIQDYQLYTRSLIVAEFKNGKQVAWKNLDKVWYYLNDRDKFLEYVQSEIQKSLGRM
jgi:hypothetical protein